MPTKQRSHNKSVKRVGASKLTGNRIKIAPKAILHLAKALAIKTGDAVEFNYLDDNGSRTASVGRVCRISASGMCCVQFADVGCYRVPKTSLTLTSKTAPECSDECSQCAT
jgi:hypothetical protein